MGGCCASERRAPGPRGTEKLLNPGALDYDAQMSRMWGGPAPQHFGRCWESWPSTYQVLTKRAALVTGGTGGIGFYVAKMLAHLGYEVILPVRTGFEEEAEGAAAGIRRVVPGAKITMPDVKLDLESLGSVRAFAAALCAERQTLELLCLNAGRGGSRGDQRETTVDGLEAILQVNSISQMLLAKELLPLLQKAENARVVSQSSGARFCNAAGGLAAKKVARLADLNAKEQADYNAFHQYCISKACNVFFTLGFNERVSGAVRALPCEPGFVCTGVNIQHNLGHSMLGCLDGLLTTKRLHDMAAQHAADGALPMVLACVDDNPPERAFYHPQGGMAGAPVRFDPARGDPAKNALLDPANVEGSDWPRESSEVFWRQAEQWTGAWP